MCTDYPPNDQISSDISKQAFTWLYSRGEGQERAWETNTDVETAVESSSPVKDTEIQSQEALRETHTQSKRPDNRK